MLENKYKKKKLLFFTLGHPFRTQMRINHLRCHLLCWYWTLASSLIWLFQILHILNKICKFYYAWCHDIRMCHLLKLVLERSYFQLICPSCQCNLLNSNKTTRHALFKFLINLWNHESVPLIFLNQTSDSKVTFPSCDGHTCTTIEMVKIIFKGIECAVGYILKNCAMEKGIGIKLLFTVFQWALLICIFVILRAFCKFLSTKSISYSLVSTPTGRGKILLLVNIFCSWSFKTWLVGQI